MINKTTKRAFLDWYEPVHQAFVRFCRSHSFGLMETEDLVQESVLATLEAFDNIREKEKILGYMIGVARNIVRNKKRQLKFKAEWDQQLAEQIQAVAPGPEIAADIHFLLQAMDRLSPKQKEALELFEISGFSIREISQIQDSSEAATKKRLSRARTTLRGLLENQKKPSSLSATLSSYASILF